jgi:hypothetical protein
MVELKQESDEGAMAPELGKKIGADPFQSEFGFRGRETLDKIRLKQEYDFRKR